MKSGTARILFVAVLAGLLGVAAGLFFDRPGTDRLRMALQGLFAGPAPPAPAGVTVARRGERIPPLRLPDLDGRTVSLPAAYAGTPMLINVWASWCGPCREEMSELERYSRRQAGNGVQVIGIALDDKAAVEAFLARVPVSYPILLDAVGPADASVRLGNPKGLLPYTVLIDAQGRLQRQRIGPFAKGEIEGWVEAQ